MESELLFTDDIVCEDFSDTIKKFKPNFQSEKNKEFFKLNISEHHSMTNKDSKNELLTGSNICFSTYVGNLEQSVFTDTISVASESNDDSCSGSSLQQYDSLNDSDTFDEETILKNSKSDTIAVSNVEKTDNTFTLRNDETYEKESITNLKADIEVKWLNRSINIKKSMQERRKVLLKKIDLKSKFLFYGKYFLLTETLDVVSKVKLDLPLEEIEYEIKSTGFYVLVPRVHDVPTDTYTTSYKPALLTADNDDISYNNNFTLDDKSSATRPMKRRRIIKRSKSEMTYRSKIESQYENKPEQLKEIQNSNVSAIFPLQKKIDNLMYELQDKSKYIEEYKVNYNNMKFQIHQTNNNLQMAYDTIVKLKSNIEMQNNALGNLTNQNTEIRKTNEKLRMFKENAEKFISNERQNKEFLEKKIESYSAIENDYHWLSNAFMDYKNLCQDYDHLQITSVDMENQLAKASKSFEESNYQIKYLQNEVNKYKQHIEKLSQMNQNHSYENQCSCQTYSCDCYSHQSSNHSHKKSKRDKKKPRKVTRYYESDEDDQVRSRQVEIMKPRESINENVVKKTENKVDIKEVEKHYDDLQLKKRKLESELCHVPLTGSSNRRGTNAVMGDKEMIENELDEIDQELSSIRRTLKQFKVIGNDR